MFLACLCISLCLGLAGCKPDAPNQANAPTSAVPKSSVPLRVWFVAEPADKAVIERQWQATFDRPINVRIFSQAELLEQEKGQCDVIVYPAAVLGDLISRQWLVELPSALQSRPSGTDDSQPADPLPAGWLDQARFDRKLWGVSLSVITPVLAANFELPEPAAANSNSDSTVEQSLAYWQSVVAALKGQPPNSAADSETAIAAEVDALAVSDRFLTIFNSIHSTENRIGVLFDPETLAPRINQASAIQAVKIMQDIKSAGASPAALLGSHTSAWNALGTTTPNLTLCVPPPASPEVDKLSAYSIQPLPTNPARAGMRVSAGTNVGRGLMASMTRQCQQTGASIEFVRWLASESSRQGFAKRIQGISAESAYAPGSSAWKAQRIVQRLGQQARLPLEPRLTNNAKFRELLGSQVAAALQGQVSPEEALAAVEKSWQELINAGDKSALIESYVGSLGL